MKRFEISRKELENALRGEVSFRILRELHEFEVVLSTYDEEEEACYGNATIKQMLVMLDANLEVIEIQVGYDVACDNPSYAVDTFETFAEFKESCYSTEELGYYLPFVA